MKREPQSVGNNPGNHLAFTVTSKGSITKGERDSLFQVARFTMASRCPPAQPRFQVSGEVQARTLFSAP